MITMKMDLINPYVVKIIIAARKEDSIRAISQRIKVSYGWTYKWVQALAKIGVFRLTKTKVYINEKNRFYRKTIAYIRDILTRDVSFFYSVLGLFGITYCFTKTDAIFIWTKGGYNIARYKLFYPIFIKIKKEERKIFESYCRKLHISTKKRKDIFYDVKYVDQIDPIKSDGIPVDSLEETISFMEERRYNFEPALEMIKEMYKKRIKGEYREVVTNV